MRYFFTLLTATLFCFARPPETIAKSSSDSNHPHRAPFSLQIGDIETNLETISIMVMPGERVLIQADVPLGINQDHSIARNGAWEWKAPKKPGLYSLKLTHEARHISLHIFVLTPFDTAVEESIGTFKIGSYQQSLFKGQKSYAPPQGFIAVTEQMRDIQISPHFTLGQFICKQENDNGISYALINPAMLLKLERLLEVVNDAGHPAKSFHIMSGFRTPWYNASIGNKTSVSRHLYGDGVDLFIDEDGDNYMDDLNGDGVSNKADAQILYSLASLLSAENIDDWKGGGLSLYKEKPHRGPFIHLDARGYQARW